MIKTKRGLGKTTRVTVRYKAHELEILDKKRKKANRSDYIRAKSLA